MLTRQITENLYHAALRRCAVLAVCAGLGGCAMAPFGAFESGSIGEGRSHSCAGLALERQQYLARIAALEGAMSAELANPPKTLAHAFQRMGSSPQIGTEAYGELTSEQARLEANRVEAMRIPCAAEVAKLP